MNGQWLGGKRLIRSCFNGMFLFSHSFPTSSPHYPTHSNVLRVRPRWSTWRWKRLDPIKSTFSRFLPTRFNSLWIKRKTTNYFGFLTPEILTKSISPRSKTFHSSSTTTPSNFVWSFKTGMFDSCTPTLKNSFCLSIFFGPQIAVCLSHSVISGNVPFIFLFSLFLHAVILSSD